MELYLIFIGLHWYTWKIFNKQFHFRRGGYQYEFDGSNSASCIPKSRTPRHRFQRTNCGLLLKTQNHDSQVRVFVWWKLSRCKTGFSIVSRDDLTRYSGWNSSESLFLRLSPNSVSPSHKLIISPWVYLPIQTAKLAPLGHVTPLPDPCTIVDPTRFYLSGQIFTYQTNYQPLFVIMHILNTTLKPKN